MAFGYRSSEVASLGRVTEYDEKRVDIIHVRPDIEQMQVPEMVSLGMHIKGICLPHVDTRHPETLRDGVAFRMGKIMPQREDGFLESLRKTVSGWVSKEMVPLAHDTDVSFETWIEGTNYDLSRKNELRKINEEVIEPLERINGGLKYFIVKLFSKDETYVDFKHARGIYARDDVAKVFFGPWFKVIENELYKKPTFIKHVPVSERGEYIYERLYREGEVYVQTDYSSYEAHFDKDLMANCEFILYDWMLSGIDGSSRILETMNEVLRGSNRVFNKNVICHVLACRMSGEMNTSLGNGFSNYMLMLNQCERLGQECVGVVEGDDGLFVFPKNSKPSTEDFTRSGCIIKLEVFEKISHASFCGLLFDENDRQIIADIRKIMVGLSWSSKQYVGAKQTKLKSLLRCKAMSMLVQYPSCPVIAEMSRCIIRLTKHIDVRKVLISNKMGLYDRERLEYGVKNFRHNMNASIGLGTRLLVEELWGFTLETQFRLEEKFANMQSIEEVCIDELHDLFPDSWKRYWDSHVEEIDVTWNLRQAYTQRLA